MSEAVIQTESRLKIGIFGGSFNPIHNGHLNAVQNFIDQIGLDLVLLVPAAVSFYKEADSTDFEHRYRMCLLAAHGLPESVTVSAIERSRSNGMHTCDLVKTVASQYAGSEIFLLVGSDIYPRLPIWQGIDAILAAAHICVLNRSGDKNYRLPEPTVAELESRGGRTTLLTGDALPISSTAIRERVKTGRPIGAWVPAQVEEYIRDNELYLFTDIRPQSWPKT